LTKPVPRSCATLILTCNGDTIDGHPFPTRRSSDLASDVAAYCICENENLSNAELQALTAEGELEAFKAVDASSVPVPSAFEEDRSEEHTSELQSREKLVCRLLLEKKKK